MLYLDPPGRPTPQTPTEPLLAAPLLHASVALGCEDQHGLTRALGAISGNVSEVPWEQLRRDSGRQTMEGALLDGAARSGVVFLHVRLGGRVLAPGLVAAMRQRLHSPGLVVAWLDDVEPSGVLPAWVVDLSRVVDLMLFTDATRPAALLAATGRAAGYLLPAYDPAAFSPLQCPENASVGWVGDNYAQLDGGARAGIVGVLCSTFGANLQLHGLWWGDVVNRADRETFCRCCSASRVFVGMGLRDDLQWYTSDRMTRAMGAGAVYAFQAFAGWRDWGVVPGVHALVWHDVADLIPLLQDWTRDERRADRAAMRLAAATLAQRWTWGAAVAGMRLMLADLIGRGDGHVGTKQENAADRPRGA